MRFGSVNIINRNYICIDCRLSKRWPAYGAPKCSTCGKKMVRGKPPKKTDDKAWKMLELVRIHKVKDGPSLGDVRQRVRTVRRNRAEREKDPVDPISRYLGGVRTEITYEEDERSSGWYSSQRRKKAPKK